MAGCAARSRPRFGSISLPKLASFFGDSALDFTPSNTDRLAKLPDPVAVADELQLAVLARHPTAEEAADVAVHFAKSNDHRGDAASQLIWGLLACTEFCVNH